MNNIFSGTGENVKLVNFIDELLRNTDSNITYDDIIKKYTPNECNSPKASITAKYPYIKKAVHTMKTKLKEMGLDFEYSNGKDAKQGFRYPNDNPDPFKRLRENKNDNRSPKQLLEDYCKFIKYMIPQSMGKKVPLIDEVSCPIIASDSNPNLHNIDLLPDIYDFIENQKVITFSYNDGYTSKQQIIFHPHFLKEYNNRWFLWGDLEKEDGTIIETYNYSIDRIDQDSLKELSDKNYRPKDSSFYLNLFKDIVGATIPKDKEKETIIIETLDKKVHGLMKSKPIHWSQKEIRCYIDKEQTGKFKLHLIPNREFFGNVLHYGKAIRIIEPLSIKEEIKNIVEEMRKVYM